MKMFVNSRPSAENSTDALLACSGNCEITSRATLQLLSEVLPQALNLCSVVFECIVSLILFDAFQPGNSESGKGEKLNTLGITSVFQNIIRRNAMNFPSPH